MDEVPSSNTVHFSSPLLGTWPGFGPSFFNHRRGSRNKSQNGPDRRAGDRRLIFSTLKQGMCAASTERLDGIATFPADGKHPLVSGNLISRPDVD
jgi:hypothetical protein